MKNVINIKPFIFLRHNILLQAIRIHKKAPKNSAHFTKNYFEFPPFLSLLPPHPSSPHCNVD